MIAVIYCPDEERSLMNGDDFGVYGMQVRIYPMPYARFHSGMDNADAALAVVPSGHAKAISNVMRKQPHLQVVGMDLWKGSEFVAPKIAELLGAELSVPELPLFYDEEE